MFGHERKYRFSFIRGIVKFIPYGIVMIFIAYMSSLRGSVSGHESKGVGLLLLCFSIGGIIWFGRGEPRPQKYSKQIDVPRPDRVEDDTSEESECLKCGAKIPAGSSKCWSCGWSYRSP